MRRHPSGRRDMTSKLIRAVVMIGALLGPALAANAADLRARPLPYKPAPVVPLYGWAGFYFGINGGLGRGGPPLGAPPPFRTRRPRAPRRPPPAHQLPHRALGVRIPR